MLMAASSDPPIYSSAQLAVLTSFLILNHTDSGQKDKRKRNSTGNFSKKFPEYNPDPASGDFGMSLHECAPSHENEYVPLVVELCTKAIEERGLDFVGIYRVPGNKAAVELLKKELNQVCELNVLSVAIDQI